MALDELNTLDLGSATTTEQSAPAEPSNETEIEVVDESAPDPDVETEGAEQTEDDGQDDPWKGYIDLEINGKTYKIPEEVKDGYLKEADYRQKTQATAEMKRSLEARQAEVEQMYQTSEEVLKARAAKMGIEGQLKDYENVDFMKLQREDPLAAQEHWMRFQQLKDASRQVDDYLTDAQKTRTEAMERETANRMQATAEFARKELKGWTPELDNKITEFAVKDLGFDVDTLKRSYNPQVYKTLYLAHLGQQLLSKQAAPARTAPPQKPLTTVSPKGGTVQKTVAQMSVSEMAAYLNKRS